MPKLQALVEEVLEWQGFQATWQLHSIQDLIKSPTKTQVFKAVRERCASDVLVEFMAKGQTPKLGRKGHSIQVTIETKSQPGNLHRKSGKLNQKNHPNLWMEISQKKNVWNTSWGTSTQEGFQEISPLPGSDWNLLPALSSPSLPEGWRHPMADRNHLPGSTLPMLLETSCHPSFGWNVLPRRVFAVCWGAGDWREATVYLQSWRSVTVWAVGHSLSSAWSHAPRSSSVGYLVDSEDSGWNKNQTPNAAGHLGTPHLPEVDWINLIRTSSGNHPILRSMCSSKIKTTRSTRIHHAKWELRRNKCCAHNLSYNMVLPI